MTMREIIAQHLRQIGADGLCRHDCGCGLKYLMPCDGPELDCVPARRFEPNTCDDPECEYRDDVHYNEWTALSGPMTACPTCHQYAHCQCDKPERWEDS